MPNCTALTAAAGGARLAGAGEIPGDYGHDAGEEERGGVDGERRPAAGQGDHGAAKNGPDDAAEGGDHLVQAGGLLYLLLADNVDKAGLEGRAGEVAADGQNATQHDQGPKRGPGPEDEERNAGHQSEADEVHGDQQPAPVHAVSYGAGDAADEHGSQKLHGHDGGHGGGGAGGLKDPKAQGHAVEPIADP